MDQGFRSILSCMMKKQDTRGLGGIGDTWHHTGKYRK